MNALKTSLQELVGGMPEGIAGTRVVTELSGGELKLVGGAGSVVVGDSSIVRPGGSSSKR